jgi:integrase
VRFRDLRHFAATVLLAKGVHPKIVRELRGHSRVGITRDIYSHILPRDVDRCLAELVR